MIDLNGMTPYHAYITFVHTDCNYTKSEILKLEGIISQSQLFSFLYSKCILKGPFHRGHPVLFRDSIFKNRYITFLKSINYNINEIGEWLI
jgi:hypothetical protein